MGWKDQLLGELNAAPELLKHSQGQLTSLSWLDSLITSEITWAATRSYGNKTAGADSDDYCG